MSVTRIFLQETENNEVRVNFPAGMFPDMAR